MIYAAIKLSENTKKALIILFLIFIILFVLIGYISLAVQGVMKKQGSKADEMLHDVVKADYFEKEKQKFLSFHIHVENNIPTGMSVNLLSLLMVILG